MTPACFYWFWIGKVKTMSLSCLLRCLLTISSIEEGTGDDYNRNAWWGQTGGGRRRKRQNCFFLCHSGFVAHINDQLFAERTGCCDQRNRARAWPERGKKADLAFSVSPRVKSDEGASGGSVHWVCVRGQHHLDKPESTCSCDWHLGLNLLIKLKVLKVFVYAMPILG